MTPWKMVNVDDVDTRVPTSGILIHTHSVANATRPVLAPDAGDFAKWMASNHPEVAVEALKGDHLALHSHDIWLPLVSLAGDVTVQVYLGIVSSYLYDRFRGALARTKPPQVSLSVEVIEDGDGKRKRLEFEGDHAALRELLTKIDGNKLLE